MKFALVSGTSISHSPIFSGWIPLTVETKYGTVTLRSRGDQVVLNRHGNAPAPLPPHSINARAHFAALDQLGFKDVVSFNSVGSLRSSLVPGTFVSCSDYVAIQQPPATYHDEVLQAGAPGIANNLVPVILAALSDEFTITTGQTYVHTLGPRFETKAEIRVMKNWGDVVGMTLAPEADLCTELGLRYNSLGMVDNYANGIGSAAIDYASFKQMVHDNQELVNRFIVRLLEILT